MRTLSVAITLAAVLVVAGCGRVVDWDKLQKRGGLFYEINSEEPFTGIGVDYWPSGQKQGEVEYRDGKPHGKMTTWYKNGQKEEDVEFRDGHIISRNQWNEDGTPK